MVLEMMIFVGATVIKASVLGEATVLEMMIFVGDARCGEGAC
jgi:hypothetical protein